MTDLITELHALAQRMAAAVETDEPTIVALAAEEIGRLQNLADRLKQEAECHAQEARTQRSTVLEIYRALGIKKGDWNGKAPVMQKLDEIEHQRDKALADADQWSAAHDKLEAEVERLQRELNHQRLIHVGFTDNDQIESAKQGSGSFYPSTENDNWIPVYMLVKHAHRCGRDSETFCRLLELEQENKGLRSEIEMRKLQVTGAAKVIQEEKNDNSKLREERDQLKAAVTLAIDTFRRYEMDVETYPTIDHIKMMRNLNGVLAAHDAEVIEREAKPIATEFFRWWYNQPGSNTDQGFDEWWQLRQQAKEVQS